MYRLGIACIRGIGMKEDRARGEKLLLAAAEDEDPEAMTALGIAYIRELIEGGMAKGFEFIDKAAEAGEPEAMFQKGANLKPGASSASDPAKALEWLKKAADAGHSGAMYAIGTMYWAGDGVPEDKEEGSKWYEKSEDAEKLEKQSRRPFFEVLLND